MGSRSSRRALLLLPSLLLLAACPQEGDHLAMRVQAEAERAFLAAVRSFAEANAYTFDDQAFADSLTYRQIDLNGLRSSVSVSGNVSMGFEAYFTRKYNLVDFVSHLDLAALVQDFRRRVSSVGGVELVDRRSQ